MSDVGVIDTGVLIGFTIKNDQHHETTREYILKTGPAKLFIPPRAKTEFDNAESYIRNEFNQEVIDHRHAVSNNINSTTIHKGVIKYIRDQILDESAQSRVYAFLYRWYTNLYKQDVTLQKPDLIRRLSNIETEVLQDRSKKWGGWQNHIDVWSGTTGNYPRIKSKLLLSDQPDLDILLESHHIATQQNPKKVEFATANPQDFVHQNNGEPRRREDDILKETQLVAIENLCHPLSRHYP